MMTNVLEGVDNCCRNFKEVQLGDTQKVRSKAVDLTESYIYRMDEESCRSAGEPKEVGNLVSISAVLNRL